MQELTTRPFFGSRRHAQLLIACAFLSIFSFSLPVAGSTPRIGILFSRHSSAQVAVVKEIQQVLDRSFSGSATITLATTENGDIETLSHTPQDLIVTVGIEAAAACHDRCRAANLLRTLIPERTAESALLDNRDQRVFNIYLDQPIMRLLKLLKIALPYHRDVAVMLGPSSVSFATELKRAAKRTGVDLHIEQISDQSELIISLERLLKQSQVLLAIPDPLIYNRFTVQKILLTTYRHQTPVVSFSAALVRAGATLAVYSSPEQIGQHIGEAAAEIVNHGDNLRPFSSPPRYYSVSVNHQVARSLGLNIPSEETLYHLLIDSDK